MKVAVVWNNRKNGVISRFGRPCPEAYAKRHVQGVMEALRASGHTVACLEADKTLLTELEKFLPPGADTGRPAGLVFNMAYGIQGECRYTHVPAMLEMAGVPYIGSSPLGHALALDKVITKILAREAGVPTPTFRVMSRPEEDAGGLRFPLVVKPRHESTSYGLHLVRNHPELDGAVRSVVEQYQQEALVEEYIDGREVCIGLLGNREIEFLPPVELDFSGRAMHLMTWDDKYHKRVDEPKKICPAPLSESLGAELHQLSLAVFRACHCQDYARVDIRIDSAGRPFVLEINSMASLGEGGSFVRAAAQAGYSFTSLVSRILDVAHERYFGVPAPRGVCAAGTATAGAVENGSAYAHPA
jgi:D-alanine-D-alanine ligase